MNDGFTMEHIRAAKQALLNNDGEPERLHYFFTSSQLDDWDFVCRMVSTYRCERVKFVAQREIPEED